MCSAPLYLSLAAAILWLKEHWLREGDIWWGQVRIYVKIAQCLQKRRPHWKKYESGSWPLVLLFASERIVFLSDEQKKTPVRSLRPVTGLEPNTSDVSFTVWSSSIRLILRGTKLWRANWRIGYLPLKKKRKEEEEKGLSVFLLLEDSVWPCLRRSWQLVNASCVQLTEDLKKQSNGIEWADFFIVSSGHVGHHC